MSKPSTLGALLRPTQGSGQTKQASAGPGFSSSEMEKAAAVAAAQETIQVMTKEAEEKLGKQLAYLGYCFGWGMNKAAAEFYNIQKQAVGDTGMAPTAGPAGAGDPGSNDPKSLLQDNEDMKLKGWPGHGGVTSKIEGLIHGKVLQGATASGTTMNTGEQASKKGSDLAAQGAAFRELIMSRLQGGGQ